ncbi:hypothetical protein [Nostoc sp. CMAA1605]|nr:hypothetical protein [Nostoc sp. CMAA1605]
MEVAESELIGDWGLGTGDWGIGKILLLPFTFLLLPLLRIANCELR